MNDPWHILIIDDSEDDRANVRRLLLRGSDRRYRFTEVASGTAGISAIQNPKIGPPGGLSDGQSDGWFDCVLLDLNLPDMMACDVLTALCAGSALPPCPVVVITGWTGAARSDGPTLLRKGAQDYLGKSWLSPESLTRAVENAAERYAMLIELDAARHAAEAASLAKSAFLSHMTHELRTPLHAILGFAQLMDTQGASTVASQKKSLDQILKGGWYLLDLINEILDLALVDSGQAKLALVPVSVAGVMLECQALLAPTAAARGMDMSFELRGTPGWVRADRQRLKQVVLNLLSNAIKYGDANTRIVVTCTEGIATCVHIAVEDQSPGISAVKLAELFQPFIRLNQDVPSPEGTGIGLVVFKRLVELMGGVVGVHSTMGVGSVFWFDLEAAVLPLPLLPLDSQAEPTRIPPLAGELSAPVYTLLYVEDNAANRMLMESLISLRPDLRLVCAPDGVSGLAMARAAPPDLILLDINLPDISGTQVLQKLKADSATAHIPVLALSANAMAQDVERGLQAGFLHYVTKPIKVGAFMATLDEVLKAAPAATSTTILTTPHSLDIQEAQ